MNKGGRPRGHESLAMEKGRIGTSFFTKQSARAMFTMAALYNRQITTEMYYAFPTAGQGTLLTLTKITITK